MNKPILCIDFDGVRVAIFSSRSCQPGGGVAMRTWLGNFILHEDPDVIWQDPPWFAEIEWPTEKPPAMVTIDDRAITFTGVWPSMESLKAFQPWNKRERVA